MVETPKVITRRVARARSRSLSLRARRDAERFDSDDAQRLRPRVLTRHAAAVVVAAGTLPAHRYVQLQQLLVREDADADVDEADDDGDDDVERGADGPRTISDQMVRRRTGLLRTVTHHVTGPVFSGGVALMLVLFLRARPPLAPPSLR